MGCIRLLERVKNLGWKKERYQQNCCKAGGISMASASILAECKHQNISPSMVFDYTSILPPLDVLNTISSIVFCLTSYHKNEKWAKSLMIRRFVWARNLDSLARLPLICSKNLAWKSSPSFSGQLLLGRTSPSLPDTPVGGKTGHRPPLRDPPVGSNFTSTSLHRQILEKLGGKSGAVFFSSQKMLLICRCWLCSLYFWGLAPQNPKNILLVFSNSNDIWHDCECCFICYFINTMV